MRIGSVYSVRVGRDRNRRIRVEVVASKKDNDNGPAWVCKDHATGQTLLIREEAFEIEHEKSLGV